MIWKTLGRRLLCDVAVVLLVIRQRISDTGRDEKILLLQTKPLSTASSVIGIQDAADLFCLNRPCL